ncbi:MAG: ribosome biogenesis/translation initiation ATPase RLI [bacterium]|nr:ribosome biogenesis/translation initiation ATPase RLI [bacterium]
MPGRRIAVVDRDKCQPKKCGYRCIKFCPVYRFNKEVIKLDEQGFPVISEVLCTGCGICAKVCPYGAIKVVNLPSEQEERLVHKYPSGFRLYGLPCLREGEVVGILGRNGTGKTTSIKILAGQLLPNFGKEKITQEEILERFKRTEYYSYFEKLYNKEIKVVVKPQNISDIPKIIKGFVKDIIEKYDELKIAKEILQEFEMEEILQKRVDELSGGALQVLAITVALSRQADCLYLDEPSVYLDVRRRLALARILAEHKKTYTFIVDHDLVVLDYVAEYINILYGVPGAFGVFSGLKTVRTGINEFLQGYLKEENVLIRDKPITFDKRPRIEIPEEENRVIVEFEQLIKRFNGFELRAEGGKIYSYDLLGIIGPNSVGKSTFAKLLAGELQPDSGKLSRTVNISFKPQEIYYEDTTLAKFIGKLDSFIKNEVLKAFELDKYLELPLECLSGGELQLAWITRTLAREAELYILDEPSAFLDVEMRIKLAKVLSNFVEKKRIAVVLIDHDLQIIDYLCNKVMIFDGKPNVYGIAKGPYKIEEGLNEFLKSVGITFRRDIETYRLRANKLGSKKDKEQKEQNIYYPR